MASLVAPAVPYDYVVCVDFEATCDELSDTHGTLEVARDTQEIIELPWVVLDVAALKVRESCQIYIKPAHTPVTEFCTELTGITDDTLRDGATFAEAVEKFAGFVEGDSSRAPSCYAHTANGTWPSSATRLLERAWLCVLMHRYIDLRDVFRYWAEKKGQSLRGTSLQTCAMPSESSSPVGYTLALTTPRPSRTALQL